ncbi:MAG: cbb3-type cytochrome oxidase assembly protein CcoS [Maricaulis sp.]|jgi:cbb3-type cytochrome oxidase maturation protein|nr:cbb3-type cytochrome oxidase assembly protein CcoS [Maricaulis sp.]MDG2044020.1 cbb3-type cytochrome oxidase assembly protein CcoS [Maricaulis sp.]
MSVLIWLIPVALGLGLLGLMGFMWTLKTGQMDDLDGAAHRILMDDDKPLPPDKNQESERAEADNSGEKSR